MQPEFRHLRLGQLERELTSFPTAKDHPRPHRGWIRAIREATGVSVLEMARRLGKVPSLALYLEKSEAEYRITLGSLRAAADALGCELVYALVPKHGSIRELAEQRARNQASENVKSVEHSMALEDQAAGGVQEKIEQQTRRLLKEKLDG